MADSNPTTSGTTTTTTLRDTIDGEVVLPGDEAFEKLRFATAHEGNPAVIVRCRTTDDISRAVAFARENDLVLSVRSGGHSGAGFGTNHGGLVIDLSPFDSVEVLDAGSGLVRLGAGATWHHVATTLAEHGLAISSGDTRSVGVGGLILGGGIGWMVRHYGLTIDSVVAAEVVTAAGDVVRASADDHPELFWALRGGGGNFGVVTSFELVARPLRQVLAGTITYPAGDAASVIRAWRDAMRAAPTLVTSHIMFMPEIPGGPPPFSIGVCAPADDVEAAQAAIQPLRALGEVLGEELSVQAYADVLEEAHPPPPGFSPVAKSHFVNELTDDVIDALVAGVGSGGIFAQLRSLGGAVAEVAPDATAFAARDSEALVMAVTIDVSPEGLERFGRVREVLAPVTVGSYSNLMNTTDEDDVASIYPPDTYARLAAVKRDYDPDNTFNQNYNVVPAGASG